MFRLEMLPALDGDCLWVEWGHDPTRIHRMLVDGGRSGDRNIPIGLRERLERQPEDQRCFDLVVATHMDADHINGLAPLFRGPPKGFAAREVWFNGLRNLPESDVLGYQKADQLAAVLRKGWPQAWNASWSDSPRKAVVIPDPPEPLPVRNIAGLEITLLSPTITQLRDLTQEWPAAVRAAKLADDQAEESPSTPSDKLGKVSRDAGTPLEELATMNDDEWDKSRPNGSSIAFLASYEGRVLLLAADAHADVLTGALRRVHGGQAVRADVSPDTVNGHGGCVRRQAGRA